MPVGAVVLLPIVGRAAHPGYAEKPVPRPNHRRSLELRGRGRAAPGRENTMSDNVYKVTEIVGSSTEGVSQAIDGAIGRAAKTLHRSLRIWKPG